MIEVVAVGITTYLAYAIGVKSGEQNYEKKKKRLKKNLQNENSEVDEAIIEKKQSEIETFKNLSDKDKIEFLNKKLSMPNQFKIDFSSMLFFAQNYGDKININKSDELNVFTIKVIENFRAEREEYSSDVNNPSMKIVEESKNNYPLQKKRWTIVGGKVENFMSGKKMEEGEIINLYFDERFKTEWHTSEIAKKCIKINKDEILFLTEKQIIKQEHGQVRFMHDWNKFTQIHTDSQFDFLRTILERDLKEAEAFRKRSGKVFLFENGVEKYKDDIVKIILESKEKKNILIKNEKMTVSFLLYFDEILSQLFTIYTDTTENEKKAIEEQFKSGHMLFFEGSDLFTIAKTKVGTFYIGNIVVYDKDNKERKTIRAVRVKKELMPELNEFETNLTFVNYT